MRDRTAIQWQHFDFWLLGAVALLVVFGITMIRSAIAGNIELQELNLVGRQLIFAVVGFIVMWVQPCLDQLAGLTRALS
jgi:cell division protein FtsW (lipid II flippase)